MPALKEIVTKAVIGKSKKQLSDTIEVLTDSNISNILGCWIINHKFDGVKTSEGAKVSGSYDVNIWYSYDDNTKTNVIVKRYDYSDTINVKLKKEEVLSDTNEIIIRSLVDPKVSDAKIDGDKIKIVVDKELGVEIVGDVKVRVNIVDDFDDYEEETEEQLDMDINENYLNGVNQK